MIWLLLVLFQIKHFVCDFPLQGKYMLGKFKPYPDFVLPLGAHCLVHAIATFSIAICFKSPLAAIALALTDFSVHFVVDLLKANPDIGGRFKALTKADFVNHHIELESLRNQVRELSANQETLSQAADIYGQINDLHADWHEKEKSNKYFWWTLGADQTAHHLTHYAIIAGILL